MVLNKYAVKYFKCEKCKSLQTEKPYWLEEAYLLNLSKYDTGAAQRVINNFTKTYIICRTLNLKNIEDLGGGDGLFCRLLRDHNFNCYSKDKYAKATYAQEFQVPTFDLPDLVTAFEVVEHFSNPNMELDELFKLNSRVVLLSTGIYKDHGEDWWYLNPESGQHIFMYSQEAMKLIGSKYDYNFYLLGGLILFCKKTLWTSLKVSLIKILLKRPLYVVLKGFIFMLPASGSWKDHLRLRNLDL
jgi:hypothetical protein